MHDESLVGKLHGPAHPLNQAQAGTQVQVVTTPQGDMFVTPSPDEPQDATQDVHDPTEVAQFHHHHGDRPRRVDHDEEGRQ